LLDIAGKRDSVMSDLLPMKMTYGAIEDRSGALAG